MNRQKEKGKVKKVYAYKVVRINGDTSCNMQFLSNSLLIKEYKDGSIVEAYPGTPGIFLFKRLKDCKNFALVHPDKGWLVLLPQSSVEGKDWSMVCR